MSELTQEPDLSLYSIIPPPLFSPERLRQLESGVFPEYTDMTIDQLKAEMRRRSFGLRGRRKQQHFNNALEADDEKELREYQMWKKHVKRVSDADKARPDGWELPLNPERFYTGRRMGSPLKELMKARQGRMFQSLYKQDPNRKTFLDLPPELRIHIYELALWGPTKSIVGMKLTLVSGGRLLPHEWEYNTSDWFHQDMTIYTFSMMQAINKQIQKEVRVAFWASNDFFFALSVMPAIEGFRQFLTRIGSDESAVLTKVDFRMPRHDASPAGHKSLHQLLPHLAGCAKLRSLQLVITVSNVFRGELDALKAYFLSGEPFSSKGLNDLINTFCSLSDLKTVHLRMKSEWAQYKDLQQEDEQFLLFAFSGMREVMLWLEMKERLKATHVHAEGDDEVRKLDDRVLVFIDHDHYPRFDPGNDTMNYEVWQK